ncbi:hypothetical protein BTE77_27865 [Ensifer adhaerens]|nr:hypothetical protein BTE77_27865 [Ensifer adhaerens]
MIEADRSKDTPIHPSYTQGFALVSPQASILGHSYRPTVAEAIATAFETQEQWAERQAEGWSVQPVYARVFAPRYFPSKPQQDEPHERDPND